MSLFGSLLNRKKQVKEQEKEKSIKEAFEEEEEELLEDPAFYEEAGMEEEVEPSDEEEDPNIEYEIVEREILPAKIICPDCGGITLEGLDFCDKCGGELH
jgi:hypothetical protein